jgi:hypothetical protein
MSPTRGSLRVRPVASAFRWTLFALCLIPFAVLATMNSAGYRYGASDQAFYGPAVLKAIDPTLYPRDSDVIRSQAKLTLVDNLLAPIVRGLSMPLPLAFAALHVVALGLLAAAGLLIASALYRTSYAAIALLAALTLRHAISKSGTNTLEGYFHPRQLAFGFGALAIAAFLRGGSTTPIALVVIAGLLHPTTALWFALCLGAALLAREHRTASPRAAIVVALSIIAAATIAWAVTTGPLQGRLVRMDPEWLETLAAKDYLFPLEWPAVTWLLNLAYLPLIVMVYRWRERLGIAGRSESGLVVGCVLLLIVFLATLPFNAARVALAIQLQPARVFWLLDFIAVTYAVWAMVEGGASVVRARTAMAILILVSVIRGGYVMFGEFPDRRIVQATLTDDDWGRAMAWARTTDVRSGWLAHPSHAAKYGSSVRVAGTRDVFVEAIKDQAVGMYDRDVALRTRDRVRTLGDFDALTAGRALALAREFDLDYLVTERSLDLPEAFHSGPIRVYRLR